MISSLSYSLPVEWFVTINLSTYANLDVALGLAMPSTIIDPFTLAGAASAAIDPSFGLVRAMSGTFEASLEESGAAAVAASTSVDPLFTLAASAAIDPSFGLVRAMSGTFEASLEESGAAAADPLLGLAEDTWAAVAASTSVDPLFTLAASAAIDPSFGLVRAMSGTFEASLEESGAAAADPLLGLAEDTWAAVAASTSVDPLFTLAASAAIDPSFGLEESGAAATDPLLGLAGAKWAAAAASTSVDRSFTLVGAASAATDRLLGLAWPPSANVDSSSGAAWAASAVDSLCLRCFTHLKVKSSKHIYWYMEKVVDTGVKHPNALKMRFFPHPTFTRHPSCHPPRPPSKHHFLWGA